jgi:hypothetical protein
MAVVKIEQELVCNLDGQGLQAGKSYYVWKYIYEEVALGLITSAVVRNDEGYLTQVKNAHLAFNLEQCA